jgi:hypothetical protein
MALEAALIWIQAALFGPIATILMVIAVAMVGLRLLLGYGSVRNAATVLIGCFILSGASALSSQIASVSSTQPLVISPPPRAPDADRSRPVRDRPANTQVNPFAPYPARGG